MSFKPSYPAICRTTLSDNDECRSRSFINYVKLIDREKNDYKVRIDASCKKFSVSIHPEYRRLVEFSTCSECPHSMLNYAGSGVGNRCVNTIRKNAQKLCNESFHK